MADKENEEDRLDPASRPQILEHARAPLALTGYETRWVPDSARLVALGSYPRNTGCLQAGAGPCARLDPQAAHMQSSPPGQVYALQGPALEKQLEVEKASPFRCGTFGASSRADRHLATGNFAGRLQVWDLQSPGQPVYEAQAHVGVVNRVEGCAGQSEGKGPPELATCGKDGGARVWDVRQPDRPVAAFDPAVKELARDCWCLAFGNAFNEEERCLLAGYDNGDVKLFDLRTNSVRWQRNLGDGVCAVQFDRQAIEMNKFVVACLEGGFQAFDARTQHSRKGFASVAHKRGTGSTLWGCHHLPQNRDVWAITAGDGALGLYRYRYPHQRKRKAAGGLFEGVAGRIQTLATQGFAEQPLVSLDWHPDRLGLFCCASLDQCLRVGIVTKLQQF